MKTKKQEVKSYTTSKVPVKHKFTNLVQKCTYIPEMDRLACFEEGTNKVLFYCLETGFMNDLPLEVKPKPLKSQMTMVIKDQNNHINIETQESVINRKTMILDIHFIKDAKYQVCG